jgi:glycosyltransferase involved in cell wall biosynthesis
MSLNIAWVTPYSSASDVSAFSRNILTELSHAVQAMDGSVTLVVNPNGRSFWSPLPTLYLTGSRQDRELLSCFDIVIYNIGNNSRNHGYLNFLALEVPGIVIIHDLVMQHFLAKEIFETIGHKYLYTRMIGEYYGDPGLAKVAQSQICSEINDPIYAPWDSAHVASMPLLEPFIESAAAVVVHSDYAERFAKSHSSGPILRLALPWDQKLSLTEQDLAKWREHTARRANCQIVCFGHIGRSKCLDLVIGALIESDQLRRSACITIAGFPGDVEYVGELQSMVQSSGLSGVVNFEFAVSDEKLLEIKRGADIFVNLRYPNTESASGSLVEQMNAGKPVLIFPSGCYAEISPGAAIPVERKDGARGVADALEAIVADPEARIRIGARGRDFVRRVGRREYVAGLLEFITNHQRILGQRKRCSVGSRSALADILPGDVGEVWLDRLTRVRRLIAELRAPGHMVATEPFLSWDSRALTRYMTVGLFGQAGGPAFERECRHLLAHHDRSEVFEIVGVARVIWLLCRAGGDHAGTEAAKLAILFPTLRPEVYILLRALGNETLATALYLGLLGRYPDYSEIDSYAKRMAHETLEKMINEFIHSAEFRQRHTSAAMFLPLLDWCRKEHFYTSTHGYLDFGTTHRFLPNSVDSICYLGLGWHQAEAGQVWSRTKVSNLNFAVSEEYAALDLSLLVSGRFAATSHTGPRSLQITCNGGPEKCAQVINDHWFVVAIDLPPPSGSGGDFSVAFDAGFTINLAGAGIESDTRDLGFCLQSISLRGRDQIPIDPEDLRLEYTFS